MIQIRSRLDQLEVETNTTTEAAAIRAFAGFEVAERDAVGKAGAFVDGVALRRGAAHRIGSGTLFAKVDDGVGADLFQERLEAVGRLLSEHQYSLADVALRCGFSSQQHMATVMKKFAGVTPSDARRLNTPQRIQHL